MEARIGRKSVPDMTDRGAKRGVRLGADMASFGDALEGTTGGTAQKHGWERVLYTSGWQVVQITTVHTEQQVLALSELASGWRTARERVVLTQQVPNSACSTTSLSSTRQIETFCPLL
jgi:hypothetical protein